MSDSFKSLMIQHADVLRDLIEHEGEIEPHHEAVIRSLMQKVDALDSFRSALESEEARLDRLVKMLAQAKKQVVSRKDWLDQYIIQSLTDQGETEITGDVVKLALQLNPPSVVIEDVKLIPAEYMTAREVVVESCPDKKAIGYALKSGADVPGAKLSRSVRVVSKVMSILTKAKKVIDV